MISIHAPAKVNLALRVLAREDSGFHQLETLFVALELGDSLTLAPAGQSVSLVTDGPPMGPPEENLVHRAARAFLEKAGMRGGVEIHLEKRIPLKAGLGGGSSDAAATLKGMDGLFPGAVSTGELMEIAAELGADVPFFLSPSPLALGWGRGDRLAPLAPLPQAPIVLAFPPLGVETPRAYALLARHREETEVVAPRGVLDLGGLSDWDALEGFAANDFEAPIFAAHPLLEEIRKGMRASGPRFSLLSGSGSALFAVYRDQAEAAFALDRLQEAFPEIRFVLTRTLQRMPGPTSPAGG